MEYDGGDESVSKVITRECERMHAQVACCRSFS